MFFWVMAYFLNLLYFSGELLGICAIIKNRDLTTFVHWTACDTRATYSCSKLLFWPDQTHTGFLLRLDNSSVICKIPPGEMDKYQLIGIITSHHPLFHIFQLEFCWRQLIARKSALEKTQLSDVLITDNLLWYSVCRFKSQPY